MQLEEALLSILVSQQKKYNKVNELLDLTKEMETCLGKNDQVSFQMLMLMRQQVMLDIDKIDGLRNVLFHGMPVEFREKAKYAMSKEAKVEMLESKQEIQIAELSAKIQRFLERIISIDRVMNQKIGGKESYYETGIAK